MNNIKRFVMKNKILSLILLAIISLFLISFLVSEISKAIEIGKKEKSLKADFQAFVTDFKEGKSFEANMMFLDNDSNYMLAGAAKAPAKEDYLKLGYIDYIGTVDYMLEYYKMFNIKILKVEKMDEKNATLLVSAKRPNYLKHMNECDAENVKNKNYNFNTAFIAKLKSDKVEYITGKYKVELVKGGANWKLIYSDQMKEMLYGKSTDK